MKFELDRSDDAFVLMSLADDAEKYRLKLLNIALFVPVAQLSAQVFQEISTLMTRKTEPKNIGIHYRRIEVRPISLPRNKEEISPSPLLPHPRCLSTSHEAIAYKKSRYLPKSGH